MAGGQRRGGLGVKRLLAKDLTERSLAHEDAGTGDDVTLDGNLDGRPVLHLGNDLIAAAVDNDGIFGTRGTYARTPGKSHV
jgi:hypothetical protein